MAIKQFSIYIAKHDLKVGRKRFKKDTIVSVTSPQYNNIETVLIDRKNTAKLNIGSKISVNDLNKYFLEV